MDEQTVIIQKKILNILKWFHNFCVENNLTYYAVGGTLLGSVRHKGFIPWDDDIDVGMPRKDYDRFISLTKGKKFLDYVVEENPGFKEDSGFILTKIYDTTTTFIAKTKNPIKRGIDIDVFPLDGLGNTEEEKNDFYKKIVFWEKLLYIKTCTLRKGRSFFKNLSIILAKFIPPFIINVKKLVIKIDKLMRSYDYESSKFVGNLVGSYFEREIVERDVFGNPKLYQFEDMQIYGPEKYDDYLKHIYGDYMKLPPKDKQVPHHEYYEINLNKSYLED